MTDDTEKAIEFNIDEEFYKAINSQTNSDDVLNAGIFLYLDAKDTIDFFNKTIKHRSSELSGGIPLYEYLSATSHSMMPFINICLNELFSEEHIKNTEWAIEKLRGKDFLPKFNNFLTLLKHDLLLLKLNLVNYHKVGNMIKQTMGNPQCETLE